MNDALGMIIAGRLMMLLSQLSVRDARCLSIYIDAVSAAVRQRAGAGQCVNLGEIEPILNEQLEMLEASLRKRSPQFAQPHADEQPPELAEADRDVVSEPDVEVHAGRRKPATASGYIPVVKSMEEKLKDDRKPVQKLLLEDCVAAGLVDVPKARELISGMTGKTSQDSEREIVEHLRQVLQGQVKGFIRKAKGGPWKNPRAQEDLRKDIHAANTVRGVLTLCRQIIKEYQCWEKEHGQGGILGLFSARHRSIGA